MEICIMKNGQSAPNDMQLHDKKNLKLEYPVDVYQLNLNKLQTGFIRWHWHEEMEIATVLSGRVLYKIADDTIELGTGQGIIVTPNVLHSIYPQGDTECILQVVIFHPVFLFDYSETYMCTKYIAPVTAGYRYMALTEDKVYTEKVLRTLSDLIEIHNEKKFGYEIAVKGCLCTLWLHLLEQYIIDAPKIRENSLSSDEARAKKALTYIHEHYADNVTLEAIANAIHISKSECCRCFKRTLQMTPFEYLIKYRIYMSTNLILQNSPKAASISELAMSVGFNSTSYFNKWFRHYLKCTPTQYKRNHLLVDPVDSSRKSEDINSNFGITF